MKREKILAIVDQLVEKGWSVTPDFIPAALVQDVLKEQKQLIAEGEFRRAGVGRGENLQVRPEVRRDEVMWLDQENLSPLQHQYWQVVDELRLTLNKELYLNLKGFEAHYTQYPPGAFYKRHIDQFKQVQYRIISCIIYLNADWKKEDGGQLRIYSNKDGLESFVDIWPQAGTFTCFMSDSIEHEVLPTNRERNSITGWIRR